LKTGHGRLPVTKPIEPPTLKTDLNALGKPGAFFVVRFPMTWRVGSMGFASLYPSYVATGLIVFVGGERKWFDVVGTPIGGINALAHGAME
jgi:hypothetical protein